MIEVSSIQFVIRFLAGFSPAALTFGLNAKVQRIGKLPRRNLIINTEFILR